MITFKEIYEIFNRTGQIISADKMQYNCFGDYCFIIDDGFDISVYFDILTHEIYMVEKFAEEDEPSDVWINLNYKDAYFAECDQRCPGLRNCTIVGDDELDSWFR